MTDKRTLLDPTAEHAPARRERVTRPISLEGLTFGLLDISKDRSDIFLDQVETQLVERGLTVRRYQKPTFARIAPTELKQRIVVECDVVIEALAD